MYGTTGRPNDCEKSLISLSSRRYVNSGITKHCSMNVSESTSRSESGRGVCISLPYRPLQAPLGLLSQTYSKSLAKAKGVQRLSRMLMSTWMWGKWADNLRPGRNCARLYRASNTGWLHEDCRASAPILKDQSYPKASRVAQCFIRFHVFGQ